MPELRLDASLLDKMAVRYGKPKKYMREQVSKRAARSGISSSAAQLVWAKELGIGVANRLAKVSAEIRQEVRSVAEGGGITGTAVNQPHKARSAQKAEPITSATIRTLLLDDQLYARCKDLLQAPRHYDRVIREATTVLDDRLKKITGIKNMNPENLVGKVLNPDPSRAVIEISADRSEQDAVYSICKGIMLGFRNPAHHSLSDKFTREDALKFCGFVDTALGLIQKGTVHPDRI